MRQHTLNQSYWTKEIRFHNQFCLLLTVTQLAPTQLSFPPIHFSNSPKSSNAPKIDMPALLTKTSIRPQFLVPSSTIFCICSLPEVRSRGSHIPPSISTFLTRDVDLEGVREVAITWWPALRTRRVRDLPNPAEQPVMSQTRGFWDVTMRVNVPVG